MKKEKLAVEEWTKVRVSRHQVPLLVNHGPNIMMKIVITAPVSGELEALRFSLEGSDSYQMFSKIKIYCTGSRDEYSGDDFFGSVVPESYDIKVEGHHSLLEGKNSFWITCELTEGLTLLEKAEIVFTGITLGGKGYMITKEKGKIPLPSLRIGYAMKKAGEDGIPQYRIPALVTTKKGTLIALYDVRHSNAYSSHYDLPNPVDIGMSRSKDGGRTWETMKIIMDMGHKDEEKWQGNGVGDASLLVDENTGTLWAAILWSHGNNAWAGSGKGLTPEETGQLLLIRSDDDGVTWSAPVNITSQVKDPDWHLLYQGPGRGIMLKEGTLLFPAQYQDGSEERVPFSTIMYSKDHGETWEIAKGPRPDTTESQAVQLKDGSIMINCRDNRNRTGKRIMNGGRAVYTTKDLGQNWEKHPTSDWTLPECVCQASILRLDEDHLVFFNAKSPFYGGFNGEQGGRRMFTLQVSCDDGKSWSPEKQILLDSEKGNGYSCMTVVDHTLNILYEGSGAHLVFQKIRISEVIGKQE